MKKYVTKQTIAAMLIGLIVGAGVATAVSAMTSTRAVRFSGNASFNGMGGMRPGGMRGGGFTSGEVIAKDATSLTVKAPDGSSKIVLVASSTQVTTSGSGNIDDVAIGTTVLVTGLVNSDQSVTAQNIQIRPAGVPTQRP